MKQLVSLAGKSWSARIALAFALLFAVGTFGFYACSNKEASSENVIPQKTVRNDKNAPVNPFPQIGIHHNQGLLYLAQQADFGSQSITRMAELSRVFALSQGYATLPNNAFIGISNEISTRVNNMNTLTLSVFANDHNLSQTVKSALQEIETVIQNGTNVSDTTNIPAVIQAITTDLKNLEQTFLSRNYTISEQNIIMPTIYVAINSSEFWNDASQNPNNPYNPILQDTMRRGGGIWKWLGFIGKVILGDAVGAAVGAFVGGELAGPGGVGCGAVIGAVAVSAAVIVKGP